MTSPIELSAAEIVAALFFAEMRYDPHDPQNPDNDRFVLSKGHVALALYVTLAKRGFLPDLRAHGASAKPHDPSAYPRDVLVSDLVALVEALGIGSYDLVGFSLGSRTAARGVIAGLKPRRLVLAGMGLEGLAGWNRRAAFFLDAIDRFETVKHGDPAFFAVSFMKTQKVDREAARLIQGRPTLTAQARP